MRRLGLVFQPRKADAARLAADIATTVERAGISTWVESSWDEETFGARLPDTDLLLCLGGDGTIIRGARQAALHGVPVVGVNFGKLGFLAELAPEEIAAKLPQLLAGRYRVERRLLLAVRHTRDGKLRGTHFAVNEADLRRGRYNRILRIHTWVDGQHLASYAADGLVVSTPTGSTGTVNAAQGPILPPEMRAVVLLPVLPFQSFPNPLVLPATAEIEVEVKHDHEAVLSIDGQSSLMVEDGDRLAMSAAPVPCRFARLQPPHYFYAMLVEKLQRGPILPPP